MFEGTLTLWRRYLSDARFTRSGDLQEGLANEVSRRLPSLDYTLAQVAADAETYQTANRTMGLLIDRQEAIPSDVMAQHEGALHRLHIFSEHFYWSAARIPRVFRCLPGLAYFDAPGVRNVRNKLLDHPDGEDSRLLSQNISIGGGELVTLKSAGPDAEGHPFADRGLVPNAGEFCDALWQRLQKTLDSTD